MFNYFLFDFGLLNLDSCVKFATVFKDNKPRKLPLYRAVGLSRRTLQNNSKNLKILKLQIFRNTMSRNVVYNKILLKKKPLKHQNPIKNNSGHFCLEGFLVIFSDKS